MFAFFLPSNVSHRMLEAAGKAAGTPAATQSQDLVGLISAHSWLKYTVLQCRKTWKTLRHLWAVISAYTGWISKHQDKIWHFSFNNLSLHVNALKLKTNIGEVIFCMARDVVKSVGLGLWINGICSSVRPQTLTHAHKLLLCLGPEMWRAGLHCSGITAISVLFFWSPACSISHGTFSATLFVTTLLGVHLLPTETEKWNKSKTIFCQSFANL